MVKNKKIKKLFSVVCTVLTLNFTSSIFQHNPSAIKFETTDENGYEVETITLDKPFYCIVVHDESEIEYDKTETCWNNIPLADLLFSDANVVHGPYKVTTFHVSAKKYINDMQEFLNKVSDEAELLIVVCLTDKNHLSDIPPLPYSFMATPQLKSPGVIKKLQTSLDDTRFTRLVFNNNGEGKKLITLETSKYNKSGNCIREYTLNQSGVFKVTFDSFAPCYETRPAYWHLKAPERIMSVQNLKDWLATHNPELLEQSDLKNQANRTTHNISNMTKNQKPRSNENHINPPPALHNAENKAHDISDFTPAKDASFELDSSGMPQVTDLMNDAGYNEKIIPNEPNPNIMDIETPGNETNPPQTEMSNTTSKESSYAKESETKFEIADPGITLTTDLMNDAGYKEDIIPTESSTYYSYIGEPESYYNENELKTTIFSKTKELIQKHPITSVGLGAAILTMGGTIIYNLKKLFTQQTKRSQTKNQINQKYNQHVKNKI